MKKQLFYAEKNNNAVENGYIKGRTFHAIDVEHAKCIATSMLGDVSVTQSITLCDTMGTEVASKTYYGWS